VPPGVPVCEHAPQLELLERGLAAVVCHAGHHTVCESLWHGVLLVLAPIRDDQPIVAGLVVAAGAGVRVRFNRVDAARLGTAIETVLDPSGTGRRAPGGGRSDRPVVPRGGRGRGGRGPPGAPGRGGECAFCPLTWYFQGISRRAPIECDPYDSRR
jgi:hypothetical protein